MASKTFSSAKKNGYTLQLTVNETSVNNAANTSTVSYTLTLYATSSYFSQVGVGYEVILGGSVVASAYRPNAPQLSVGQNSSVTVTSGSLTVPHNTDGSKRLTVAFSIDTAVLSYTPGPISVSGQYMDLTTIPRASTIGATDANIGSTSMIAVSKKTASYTHSIAYKFGNLTGYITSSGGTTTAEVKFSGTSIPFTVPTSFYAQIPNTKSGTCTLTLRTYSGSTLIGSPSTCTFVATAAESLCRPTVSGSVVDNNTTTVALTGNSSKLVRFYSTALCTINAAAKNSASISTKSIAGTEVSGNTLSIDNVESGNITFSATDSRGYTTSETIASDTVPYIRLTNNASGQRTSPTSGDTTLEVLGDYYNGSFGAVENILTVQYKVNNGNWISITPTIDGSAYSASASLTGLVYTQSHTIEVQVADKLATVTKKVTIGKGIPVFDWGESDFQFHVPMVDQFGSNIGNGLAASSSGQNPNTTLEHLICTDFNTPTGQAMFIATFFDGEKSTTANRSQLAIPCTQIGSTYHRYYSNGTWSSWRQHFGPGDLTFSSSRGISGDIWINSKTIYRKTFSTNATVVAGTGLSIPLGITGYSAIWIDYGNSFMRASSGVVYPLQIVQYSTGPTGLTFYIDENKNAIVANSEGGWGVGWTKVITVCYTL